MPSEWPVRNTQPWDDQLREYIDTSVAEIPVGPQGPEGPAGSTGGTGPAGAEGNDGWTPVLAVVTDGSRRVQQVVDWTGGEGTKPATGKYVGASGFVDTAAAAVDIRGSQGATGNTGGTGSTGAAGADGNDGWTPILAVVTDGTRRVHQIVDWTGGEGTKPSTTNQFIGASGIVSSAASAVDIRGAQGATGSTGGTGSAGAAGADGANGWSPVFANVADGSRIVLQVTDWTGGTGTKPATGKYVGATGLVTLISDGIDIRGAQGTAGASAQSPVVVAPEGTVNPTSLADGTFFVEYAP